MTTSTGPTAAVEGADLPHGSLPSRHQRRILVCAGPTAGGLSALHRATARWQRQYIGGVFVRIPASAAEQHRVLAEFTAAGCSPQSTHFYRPADLRALRPLARRIAGLRLADGCDPVRTAELLIVGATDVVGPYPRRDLAAARAVARCVNTRIGEDWLVRPEATPVPDTARPAGEPHGQHAPTRGELDDHFADTARVLAAEAASRLEILDQLPYDTDTDRRGVPYAIAGPCHW